MSPLPASEALPERHSGWRWVVPALLAVFLTAAALQQLRLVEHYGHAMLPGARAADSDLYAPWLGTKAALDGHDPYSASVTRQVQVGVYGHALDAGSGLDPQAFVYPAYIVFLLAPFTLLPWPAMYGLAALAGPPAIVFLAWAWLRVCGIRLSTWMAATVAVVTVTSWPAVWSCFPGSLPSMWPPPWPAQRCCICRRTTWPRASCWPWRR